MREKTSEVLSVCAMSFGFSFNPTYEFELPDCVDINLRRICYVPKNDFLSGEGGSLSHSLITHLILAPTMCGHVTFRSFAAITELSRRASGRELSELRLVQSVKC